MGQKSPEATMRVGGGAPYPPGRAPYLVERTRKMMEEERARNDMQARAMYELLVVSFFCRLLASLNI